jgi:hypothetical protein
LEIEEIKDILKPYIEEPIFSTEKGRKIYNGTIRKSVEKKFGIYIWLDITNNEIIYIGIAGKIKTEGTPSEHSIQNRLLAS